MIYPEGGLEKRILNTARYAAKASPDATSLLLSTPPARHHVSAPDPSP